MNINRKAVASFARKRICRNRVAVEGSGAFPPGQPQRQPWAGGCSPVGAV